MNATVTITSSSPCCLSSSRMCSMQGLPTIGTIGFGWFEVSGRRRVPSPPAITTAFTWPPPRPPRPPPRPPLPPRLEQVPGERYARQHHTGPEDPQRPVRPLARHHHEAE